MITVFFSESFNHFWRQFIKPYITFIHSIRFLRWLVKNVIIFRWCLRCYMIVCIARLVINLWIVFSLRFNLINFIQLTRILRWPLIIGNEFRILTTIWISNYSSCVNLLWLLSCCWLEIIVVIILIWYNLLRSLWLGRSIPWH